MPLNMSIARLDIYWMKSFETTRVQDHQKNFLAHELCQSTSKKRITNWQICWWCVGICIVLQWLYRKYKLQKPNCKQQITNCKLKFKEYITQNTTLLVMCWNLHPLTSGFTNGAVPATATTNYKQPPLMKAFANALLKNNKKCSYQRIFV